MWNLIGICCSNFYLCFTSARDAREILEPDFHLPQYFLISKLSLINSYCKNSAKLNGPQVNNSKMVWTMSPWVMAQSGLSWGQRTHKCLSRFLGSSAGLGSYENVVLKKIKKVSALLANTELYGRLYLKAEWIFLKPNPSLGRETVGC